MSDDSYTHGTSEFDDRILNEPDARWPVMPGRYRLVASLACPWATRAVIVRRLLGLEHSISLAIVDPIQDERSWRFTLDPGGVVYLGSFSKTFAPGLRVGWAVAPPAIPTASSMKA